jgi:hypothetical protein
MDAAYLKTHVGHPLRQCLTEVSEKRPYDPIEFIAHWLYKYTENVKYEEKVGAFMDAEYVWCDAVVFRYVWYGGVLRDVDVVGIPPL